MDWFIAALQRVDPEKAGVFLLAVLSLAIIDRRLASLINEVHAMSARMDVTASQVRELSTRTSRHMIEIRSSFSQLVNELLSFVREREHGETSSLERPGNRTIP